MPVEDIVDELRLPHRGRLRPVPLRHVRHRVPQGAARRRLRRLPRDAVPAEGRPQAGDRRGRGPRDEPRVLHRRCSRRSSIGDVINGWATACARTRSSRAPPTAALENVEAAASTTRSPSQAEVAAVGAGAARRESRRTSRSTARIVKPHVSIIGEFWAMTTEGDGNYGLQRFLESEGAECDIQLVTAWLLFMLWEQRCDTKLRMELRGEDNGAQGPDRRQHRARSWPAVGRRAGDPRRLPDLRRAHGPARLPPARHGRDRRDGGARSTTTTSAAAKATWRSASSS